MFNMLKHMFEGASFKFFSERGPPDPSSTVEYSIPPRPPRKVHIRLKSHPRAQKPSYVTGEN